MAKYRNKADKRLKARQKAFDDAGWTTDRGKKRPGSMKARR